MAPFGPVLDMVAKLSSTKSFCWLKEKIVVIAAHTSSVSYHLSLPPSLENHLGKLSQVGELYGSKPYPPSHVDACFPSLPFPYEQKIHHPNHPGKRCPEQFLPCYLFTQRHFYRSCWYTRGSSFQYKRCSFSIRRGRSLTLTSAPLW